MSASRGKLKKRKYSFPDNLPELADNGKVFKFGENIGYQGSIIRSIMPGTPLYHYGLIYGYDKGKRLWIIDNTGKGVVVTDFREFTNFGKSEYDFEFLRDPEKSEAIMSRAREFVKKRPYFNNRKNNCEVFVNYCHGDIEAPESTQAKFFEAVAEFLVKVAENIYLSRAKSDPEKYSGVKKSFDGLKAEIGIKEKEKSSEKTEPLTENL